MLKKIIILIISINAIIWADSTMQKNDSIIITERYPVTFILMGGINASVAIDHPYKDKAKYGFIAANFDVNLEFPLFNRNSGRLGVNLSNHYLEFDKYNERFQDKYSEEIYVTYLNFPVIWRVDLYKSANLDIYSNIGYRFGVLVRSIVNFRYENGHQSGVSTYDESSKYTNWIHYAWGGEYKLFTIKDKIGINLLVELAYNYNFNDMYKNEDFNLSSYQLSLGVKGDWLK